MCRCIFSGTYISDRQISDANYLLCVYITEEKQLNSQKNLLAIGLTIVDVSTGMSMIHEFYSSKMDERFGLDELVRIMQNIVQLKPLFIIIHFIMDDTVTKNIKLYLELDKYPNNHFFYYHDKKGSDHLNLLNPETFKISSQNDYLSKIYDLNHQLTCGKNQSPLEILGLERKNLLYH